MYFLFFYILFSTTHLKYLDTRLVNVNEDFVRIDSIKIEERCTKAGGICTIREDCPEGLLVKEYGLCYWQRNVGIECCYGISVKETRCNKRGGKCVEKNEYCNPKLIFHNATDCNEGYKCCITVF